MVICRWKKEFLSNAAAAFETSQKEVGKVKIVSPENGKISVKRQCEAIGISRSTYYYNPKGESEQTLQMMRLIDREHLRRPARGVIGEFEYSW